MKILFEVPPDTTGTGPVRFCWQRLLGNFLAAVGSNRTVVFFNHNGEQQESFILLPGNCTWMEWDKDGENLAIAQNGNGYVFIWNVNSFKTTKLDTGIKEVVTLCLWAKNNHLLAITTSKGNLLLYNHRTRKKIPVMGKHTKKITCGAWSAQNLLALASDDLTLTISNAEGDTLRSAPLSGSPILLQFTSALLGGEEGYGEEIENDSGQETVVSIVLKRNNTLYLFDIDGEVKPLELTFQPKYGEIICYDWFGEGQIAVGFNKGYMIVVSTLAGEIGREVFHNHNHANFLSHLSISSAANQLATCGDTQLKFHDMFDMTGVHNIFNIDEDKGAVNELQWTSDGQLLTLSTDTGRLITYLIRFPQLGSSYETTMAYLSTLTEVTVANHIEEDQVMRIECPLEPAFLALGPYHLAVGMNNRVWICELANQDCNMERSYQTSVSDMKLNGCYSAALCDKRIELHEIAGVKGIEEEHHHPEGRVFPGEEQQHEAITCLALTQEFLIYGTESGTLCYFFLADWQIVSEFHHVVGISKVYPDPTNTRLVFIDDKADAFIYSPVNDQLIEVPHFPASSEDILWEAWPVDKHVFVAFEKDKVHTYAYYRETYDGTKCIHVGGTKLPYGYRPLLLYNGELTCQKKTGRVQTIRLSSHNYSDDQDLSDDELVNSFAKSIILKRLKDAWLLACALDRSDVWKELSSRALYHLDLDTAIRGYQQLKDVATVMSLMEIKHIEDKSLLNGHIALILSEYDKAQDLFLSSPEPNTALEMRCDLLQWDQALDLANTLAPSRIPFISLQYAQQLEFIGDHANALIHYNKAITASPEQTDHDATCEAGVARMSIHTGDVRRGVKIAKVSPSIKLKRECAEILEGLKLYLEAGALYETAECWENAANAFIKKKNWNKVELLLPHVSSSKIYNQYAKAREAEKHYQKAAKAYELAKDYDNATRVYLDCLKQTDEAVRVVMDSQSIEGAKMVAKFFQKLEDFPSALQFLVLSNCNSEAYTMAEAHGVMDQYADVIGDNATTLDYRSIASYYQRTGHHFKAGTFFLKAKDYEHALHHFLHCTGALYPDGENIDMAIAVVGEARQDSLTAQLHSYLMGEDDNVAKEAKYLFSMYMALGQYREAAKTAVLIAREDQAAGNYRSAHDVLFNMYTDLRNRGITISSDMKQSLMLLHSYILVKVHVKRGEHMMAARLLIRVANNISKFPSHVVPILTSTVIECQRSGLKNSSFNFAAMLMKQEYRQQIDAKWKKKVEQVVRKPDKSEVEEPLEPCPFCTSLVPQMTLDCPHCKTNIPYCIVTGRHMVRDDWTNCPSCKFTALYTEFQSLLEGDEPVSCPMCFKEVNPDDLQLVNPQTITQLATTV